MRTPAILISILLFGSCFTMKEKQKNMLNHQARSSTLTTEQTLINSNTKINTITMMQDSTEEKYYIEIEPIGPFEYSPQSGFKGQASSVKLWGKRQNQTSAKDSSTSNIDLTIQTTKDTRQQSTASTKETTNATNKKTPSVNWLWLIPAVALALIILKKVLSNKL